jgi:hypothetical protein
MGLMGPIGREDIAGSHILGALHAHGVTQKKSTAIGGAFREGNGVQKRSLSANLARRGDVQREDRDRKQKE